MLHLLPHSKWGNVKKKVSTCIRIHTCVYANTWWWGQICPPPSRIGLRKTGLLRAYFALFVSYLNDYAQHIVMIVIVIVTMITKTPSTLWRPSSRSMCSAKETSWVKPDISSLPGFFNQDYDHTCVIWGIYLLCQRVAFISDPFRSSGPSQVNVDEIYISCSNIRGRKWQWRWLK